MIDPEAEEILPLTDAAKFVQRVFGGRRPSLNTVARWCIQGLRGRKLDSLKRGAQRVTSREAVVRFFQTAASNENARQVANQRDSQVEAQLIREGF